MPKFFVVGDIVTRSTFNVTVEAKDFDEAEDLAIARVKGDGSGMVTVHYHPDDTEIENISISKRTRCSRRKRPLKSSG